MKKQAKQAEERREYNRRYAQERAKKDFAVAIGRIKNPSRRKAGGESLKTFLETYFPHEFSKPFSDDQIEQLQLAEETARTGGRFLALAPRGDGKTSRIARACLWALLYNFRRFLVVICADESKAETLLEIIKAELLSNPLLKEDFPEVVAPFLAGRNSRQRMRRLTYKGKLLGLEFAPDCIRFPNIGKGSGNGQTIKSCGLTGSIRGLISATNTGASMRPDLILIDDAQTDQSARSPSQTSERETLISGAISGLAGPLEQIAIYGLLTVIRRNDLAERLLDAKLHPEFEARKYKLIYEFPKSELWEEYKEMWRTEGREKAQAFYISNRAEMDEGGRVGWIHRIRSGEISAIQTAVNLSLEMGPSFQAEMQNEPSRLTVAGYDLTEEDVLRNVSNLPIGIAPNDSTLTIATDVNLSGLHWAAIASTPECSYVIDYGKFPSQSRPIWQQGDAISEEQSIFIAVSQLADMVLKRQYKTESGEPIPPAAFLIDVGYRRDVILAVSKQLRNRFAGTQVIPIRGFGGRYYSPARNSRRGEGWHISPYGNSTALCFNSDIWRERTQKGFLVPVGSLASIGLYNGGDHRAIAAHVCGERITDVLTSAEKGTSHYIWTVLPGAKNDWLDAITYGIVGASFCGVSFGVSKKPIEVSPVPAELKAPQNPRPLNPLHSRPRKSWAANW